MNALIVHIEWTTKHRKPVLAASLDEALEECFHKTLSKRDAKLLAFGASDDHVGSRKSIGKEATGP